MSTNEKQTMLFVQLISSLHGAAMMQMGKMKNPQTGTLERNLEQAELTIDMIDMLKEKSKGNLSGEEQRFIDTVLSEVKINFVDEKNKGNA